MTRDNTVTRTQVAFFSTHRKTKSTGLTIHFALHTFASLIVEQIHIEMACCRIQRRSLQLCLLGLRDWRDLRGRCTESIFRDSSCAKRSVTGIHRRLCFNLWHANFLHFHGLFQKERLHTLESNPAAGKLAEFPFVYPNYSSELKSLNISIEPNA